MGNDEYDLERRLKHAKKIDFSESPVVEHTGNEKVVELDSTEVGIIDLESVSEVVPVEGEEEFKPKKARRIKKVNIDPWEDYKRNFSEYRFFCVKCGNTGICPTCGGKGRVKLIFHCPDCGGSGKCPHCNEEYNIECPNCGAEISRFADTCYTCGKTSTCPLCGHRLPFTATRCPSCGKEFHCPSCGRALAPGIHDTCPYCGVKIERWGKRLK